MTAYNGTFRTQLSEAERKKLKEIARSKGMTLTGMHDDLIRQYINNEKEAQHGTTRISK